MKKDKITLQTGATPTKEEILAANFLVKNRENCAIRFLAVSKIDGVRTPDIEMDGRRWEIKCPIGTGANTIKRAFESASNQAENIVFDLRHSKMTDEANLPRLKKEFRDIQKVKRLLVISKKSGLLDFRK